MESSNKLLMLKEQAVSQLQSSLELEPDSEVWHLTLQIVLKMVVLFLYSWRI